MADPAVISIPKEQWVIVATAVLSGTINKQGWGFRYYQTYRLTGEAAPSTIVTTKVPEEAVAMFTRSEQEIIVSSVGIDVYVCCFVLDTLTLPSGRIRVDV